MRKDKIRKWNKCARCTLASTRRKVVLGRGAVPAPVLFIGEGPGRSEDLLGQTFVDKSGNLLNEAIFDAAELANVQIPKYYMTNVVACRPCDSKKEPNRQPTPEEALACWPRLEETYQLVEPKEVVFLGKIATKHCHKAWPHGVSLVHPAFILRQGGGKSTEYTRFCRGLAEVFERIGGTDGKKKGQRKSQGPKSIFD